MRLGTHAVGRGRYVRRGHPVAGGAVAFLFAVGLLAAPALEAQGTQAGTQFSNWATLTFTSAGTGYAVASDTVAILVGQVAGVSLQPPRVNSGAPGTAVVFAHTLTDTIPAGASYVAGSMRWNGTPLTDATGDDAGSFVAAGNGVVVVTVGAVAGGTGGTVTFQARVDSGPARTVTNSGAATYVWSGASSTAYSNAVQTSVLVPALTLTKALVSPTQAQIGQQVLYTLRYGDATSGAPVSNVVLTDTLPAGLNYVSATPAPSTVGPVLSWAIGALAPGDSGVVNLVLQVSNTVRDTVWARNVAALTGTNATPQSASATQVALIGPPTAAVGLDLTADALEVGIGDVIPYTEVVRNPGIVPISAIRIDNTLPAGGSYARGTAIGADSVLVAGGHLILVTTAPLAPGATQTLHYAVALASASGTMVEVRAIASARAGALQPVSPQAVAWVQVRRAWPMETRAAIGKVWIDRDGTGAQGSNDGGLAGIDIWTEDGQVVTTDSTGKFSFANLRPGRHTFRLDPRTLPADYRIAGEDIQSVEASGWTTPRVDFRVVPVATPRAAAAQPAPPADRATAVRQPADEAEPAGVRPPVDFQFAATPLRDANDSAAGAGPSLVRARHSVMRYEVTVRQPVGTPLDALVAFSPLADSAVVYRDGVEFTRYAWLDNTAIPIPPARPGTNIRIVAWTSLRRDSATMWLYVVDRGGAGAGHVRRPAPVARAVVHNPLRPVVLSMQWDAGAHELSSPTAPAVAAPAAPAATAPAADTI